MTDTRIAPPLPMNRSDELVHYMRHLNSVQDTGIFRFEDIVRLIEANKAYDALLEEKRAKYKAVSNLREHAMRELKLLNEAEPKDEINDPKWSNMIDEAVLELIETFISQGHSGGSAYPVLALFEKLANFENLTPITDRPSEWHEHPDNLWQNRRNGSLFSNDGGKTYHNINKRTWFYRTFGSFAFKLNKWLPESWDILYKHGKSEHVNEQRTGA